jgi:hypothetical protein
MSGNFFSFRFWVKIIKDTPILRIKNPVELVNLLYNCGKFTKVYEITVGKQCFNYFIDKFTVFYFVFFVIFCKHKVYYYSNSICCRSM